MTQPNPAPQDGPPAGPATPPVTPPAQPPTPPADPVAAPPWGDPANFDPARAWALIQNKQADLDKAKARITELTPYQQKAQELEDAQKNELQRAQEAAAAAQKTATEAQLALLRHRVASRPDKPLPAVLVDVLQGSTEEELVAHADALLAGLTPAVPPATAPIGTTPVPALRPTTLPNPPALSLDDQIAVAQKAGKWRDVLSLQNQKLADVAGQ
jgi:hypothetical protein